MKIILLITRNSDRAAKLDSQMFGGDGITYQASLLSTKTFEGGKRPRLMLPGVLQSSDNEEQLKEKCINHLVRFGFELEDIQVEYKTEG